MKKLLFISDIMGTIDKADEFKLDSLTNYIVDLAKIHDVDEIIFSLCTSDYSEEYLLEYVNKISPILKRHNITVGRQYMSGKYLENESFIDFGYEEIIKMQEIEKYTQDFIDDIIVLYYADDYPSKEAIEGHIRENPNIAYFHLLVPYSNSDISTNTHSTSKEPNIDGVLKSLELRLKNFESIKKY